MVLNLGTEFLVARPILGGSWIGHILGEREGFLFILLSHDLAEYLIRKILLILVSHLCDNDIFSPSEQSFYSTELEEKILLSVIHHHN